MPTVQDVCVFNFPNTPAGRCSVALYRIEGVLSYSVAIPSVSPEPVVGRRASGVRGRAGARQMLAYIADQLGLSALHIWAHHVGPTE